jgi:hypothetical protein
MSAPRSATAKVSCLVRSDLQLIRSEVVPALRPATGSHRCPAPGRGRPDGSGDFNSASGGRPVTKSPSDPGSER